MVPPSIYPFLLRLEDDLQHDSKEMLDRRHVEMINRCAMKFFDEATIQIHTKYV